jgi:polyisoprenoid-binding protein YceI
MVTWRGVLAVTALALCPLAASTEPAVLKLSPDKTSLTFAVKATGHTIEGLLALESGEIRFDPESGTASGRVTIDLRRTETGNRLRDHEMHASVLETDRYPVATFRPSRIVGSLAPSGPSELLLAGVLSLHGVDHSLTLPVQARVAGEVVSAETAFEIPYVAWGLRNPSLLFLRVAPVAEVSLRTQARLHVEERPR